jgi:hypothetical protein
MKKYKYGQNKHNWCDDMNKIRSVLFFCLIMSISNMTPVFADIYDDFNTFSIQYFGAQSEPEMYNFFGTQTNFVSNGDWSYISQNSAAVAFETSLPTRAKIEYGPTTAYGQITEIDERPFFLHTHYLRGLQASTNYHYRLVATDERGNTIMGEDRSFTTQNMATAIRIPDDMAGSPPYTLRQAGATYLVTRNFTANSTAINVAATNIILDLGGNTITYDDVAGWPDNFTAGYYGLIGNNHTHGIRTGQGYSVKVYNGIVKQGPGNSWGQTMGAVPVYVRQAGVNTEVAGITADYNGTDADGILVDGLFGSNSGISIHHNIILDRGTLVSDRHAGALEGIGSGLTIPTHHNLLKRVRHRGINTGSNVNIYSNEIYVDSWATNSFGIVYYSSNSLRPVTNVTIYGNKIFGTGYHPIGIGNGFYAHNITVSSNYIQMQGQAPSDYRWPPGPGDPPGQLHFINGIRYHQGPESNILITNNTVIVKGKGVPEEIQWMRGIWTTPSGATLNISITNNRVKVEAQDQYTDGHAIAALGSDQSADPNLIMKYINNTIISNIANVRFGDSYGHGGRYQFFNTNFIKIGTDNRYKTIKMGWQGYGFNTSDHIFTDSTFSGGASYDDVSFEGAASARQYFSVAWTLNLKTSPGANVTIKDSKNNLVFQDILATGERSIQLIEYLQNRTSRNYFTPHTITIINMGNSPITQSLTMNQKRTLEVYGSSVRCQNDADQDFYGTGANCYGSDCDDNNPNVHNYLNCNHNGQQCGTYSLCVAACPIIPAEICNNGVDDDCDGKTDCNDNQDCYYNSYCRSLLNGCGVNCSTTANRGCTNRILADTCNSSFLRCDGTNDVEDILLPARILQAGSIVEVKADYECYSTARDTVALWYYNTTNWKLLNVWPGNRLTCDTVNDIIDGTIAWNFTVDSAPGTHYIRVVEVNNGANITTNPCPGIIWNYRNPSNNMFGDVDDLAFRVTGFHRSDINQNGCVDTTELSTFINRWKTSNSDVPIRELIEVIGLWKRGC